MMWARYMKRRREAMVYQGPEWDRLDIASFTCAQAGVNDLLLIEAGPEKTHLEGLSSSAVLEYVRFFLGQIKEKEIVRSLGGSLKRDRVQS